MSKKIVVAGWVAAGLLIALSFARAQKPIQASESKSVTATIVSIDHTNRIVQLKGADGAIEDVHAGPEVKRFDELKVGDKVTFRFTRSLVVHVDRSGAGAAHPTANAAVTRGSGAKPGATVAAQITAAVHVEAVDAKAGSITVKFADGRVVSDLVEDKKLLEGVKVGDDVVITYTEALLISVE